MHVLFVCRDGEKRSVAAAEIAERIAAESSIDLSAENIGLRRETTAEAGEKIALADVVCVMEEAMRWDIETMHRYRGPVYVLGIADEGYSYEQLEQTLYFKLNQLIPEFKSREK